MPRFGGPVVSSASSGKTNLSTSNSMSRIRESRTWRFPCNLYIFNLYKMPRFGGPVVSSASSGKTKLGTSISMSRFRESRTWRFHCILYMYNPYKMPRFGGPVFSSALSRKTNFSSLNSMSRIREGRTWRIHYNLYIRSLKYIKCQDLVVQFSVVFWVGTPILVVWTACRVSEKVAHGCFIVICIYI